MQIRQGEPLLVDADGKCFRGQDLQDDQNFAVGIESPAIGEYCLFRGPID